MRLKLACVAVLIGLTGCANPQVPDFMVEGTLPRFGGEDKPKAPARADAPQAAPARLQQPVQETAAQAQAQAVQAPAVQAAPVEAQTGPQPQPAPRPQAQAAAPAAAPARPVDPAVAPAPQPSAPIAAPPAKVGGFQPLQDKRKAKAVATFAADAAPIGYLLKDIDYVHSQVVNGTNYQMCLKVRRAFRETSGWRTRRAVAEVYEDLSGNLTLMTWSEVETCP